MTEEQFTELRINAKCLRAVNNVIEALEQYDEYEMDGDMPIMEMEDGDDMIDYYKKVRNKIKELNNKLTEKIEE